MKSFKKRRHSQPYLQAEALVDARNKVFNIVMAVLLVFTMLPITAFTYESQASAEPLNSSDAALLSEDSAGGSGSSADGSSGATGSESSGGGSTAPGNNGGETPSTATDPAEDNNQNNDSQSSSNNDQSSDQSNSQSGNNNSSNDDASGQGGENGTASTTGGSSESDKSDDATNESKDEESDADDSDKADSEDTRDAMAWQSKLDACELDADLTVETSKIESLENGELPSTVPATFRVDFELKPGSEKLLVNDWIKTTLPDFLTFENATYDVFRLNEDGSETTEKIADAKVENGKLKITFIEAGATEDENAVVRGFVDIDTTFSSAFLGEDQQLKQTWVAQTSEDGTENKVDVVFPTKQAVLDAWNDAHSPLGMLTNALGADEGASVQADEEGPVTETTVEIAAGAFNAQVQSTITWCDNNYGQRPSPSSLEDGFIPYYQLEGQTEFKPLFEKDGSSWILSAAAIEDLHLTEEQQARLTLPAVDITQAATNTYEVLSHALPSEVVTTTTKPRLDDDGNPEFDFENNQLFDVETTSQKISWELRDENDYPGYIDGQSTTWDHQYKMLTAPVSFNVVGKIGGQKLSEVFGEDEAGNFVFSASINDELQEGISVAEAVEKGWLVITDGEDGTTCTISGTLPQYDQNGYPIVYFIQYTGEQTGDDYFQPDYDNSASASHGGASDALFVNGTMTLRHVGTTDFHGTKQWLDNGNKANRPEVTFSLWRYSTNGGSAAGASQVTLNTDSTTPGAATNAANYVQVTLPAGSDDSVDLNALLKEQYGDAINQLPKYDPDGYPYVYALREDPIAGYEQVFGSVGEDGTVNDTPPTYEDQNGNWVRYGDVTTRPDTDRLIYNGGDDPSEGIISNRLTGTTTVNMTKTWSIAAFQDSLQNVVCEFTAQSRVKGSTNDEDWKNVDSADAVQTLSGWNAETLTKTISESFPKYDSHGNELEYRWIETNVTLEGQETNFVLNEDGTASFNIQVKDPEGANETLAFTSTPVTSTADDGTVSTTITNTFENITDQHVDKYWEQPDGTQAQIAPDPGYSDGVAKVELYQDGKLIGEFELDGQTDATTTSVEGLDGATWQETRSYHGDFENLPKYSPEGKRYNYLVLEVPMGKWYSQRTYDPETRTTRIDNYFPEGEGSEIRVTKSWLDGDDAAHRYKVEVELVAKKDMANEDGSVSYEAGDVVKPTNGQPIVLSSDELWYAEVGVPIGGLSYKDLEAREVALIDDNGTPNDTSDDVRYPVLTKDEANDDPQYTDELWLNAGWTNPENRRVVTPEHVYEVKTTYNDEIESCEVTNRRLGLLDLTVTKDWYDGLGDDVAEGTRPGATLTLSNQEYPNAFTLNENGELMVSVSGNTLPVSDSDGNPVKASIVDADGNPVTDGSGGSARIDIDTTDTSTTYEFFGLPKYDANGMNVHYDVTEAWTDDAGDYHSTKTVGDYIVEEGARHFHDTQQIDFDNRRSGTRDVTFYKTWNDNYVNDELNQRPDIYLEVYQVVGDGEPQFVDRYLHLTWSAAEEAGEGQSDASRHQKVVISDLPKYDSNGNEITYYAVEVMPADGEALNYTDVKFNYDSITAADAADADAAGDTGAEPAKSTDNAVKVSETESDDPQVNGTGWALREDGTFVNSLSDDLVANGTKLWENIPGNVEQDDLPAITVYLQQKLASDAEWPNMFVEDIGTKKVSGTVASTDQLKRDENNQYSYTITEDYQGNPLPRYDADGNLYQYRAVEIAWGLLDQPGGFTADDITGINLTPIRDGKDQTGTDLTGKVFMIQHGETGSFLLRNVYSTNSEKGNLTVKKLFSGRDANDPYPDVTFNVYRYYITGQDEHGQTEHSAPALVASHTITGDEFKAASGSGDGNNSLTYTFENLEVYAPDGSRWIYYVAEQSIDGYQTSVGTGDINGPDSRLVSGELVDATGVTVSDDSGVAMRSEDLDNANETVIKSNDTNVDVTFMNNYKPDSANLTGMKVWHDYNNIFTVRPDTLDLAFTRTAGDLTEDVEVQTGDPEGENYLAWTKKEDTGGWTFELNNIEKWAPNGKAWTYTVKEALPSGTESHYTIVAGSSSISSTSTTGFKLENALNGQATVEKKWEDGGDPYGLRPETVTVELQARYRTAATEDGAPAGNWSNWDNAYDVWTIFADKDALAGASLQPGYVTRELSANNGWKGSWNRLPVIARQTADTPINEIEYRVVEVKIGDQDISSAIKTDVDTPDENVYGEVHPYQPEFENTTASNGVNSFSSKTTNRLETAEVTASKSWKDDNLNGTDDAWGTRPVDGNNWTVTYFLQQKLEGEDDGAWKWVVKAGSEADATGSATQDGLVSFTISNGMTSDENHAVTVNDDGSVQVTWKNLPECNEDGTPYNYRIVEQVPGSYDVTGATEVKDADTAHRYFVVGAGDTGSQAFENDLRTVNLTGTKNWNDYGTGFAPTFDKNNAPQMVLYRQVGNDTTTAEQAKMKDGSAAPQPTWTNNGDGTWTFTYTGLPAANENDQPYIYWAEEQAGSGNADGFYPVYGGKDGSAQSNASNDAAGTTTDKEATADQDGAQTNEVITNVATRFTLDKLSDWRGTTGADEPEHLNGIELSVVANDRTYAVWERDANGAVTTWVNPEGGATKDAVKTDTYKMTATDAAGYIVGLHAGSYTVTETGTVPAGYAKAPDVPITISADGKITSTTQGAVENGDKPGVSAVITVDAVDPVLCGHLELTKLISSDGTVEADDAAGLKGATFDLYRVDCDNDGKDELIAKNLTSDANGKVTTVANETAIEKTASGGTFDLTYGGKYTKLSDGLPEGEYYFVETNATPGAVMPEGDAAKSEVLTITQDNHYAYTNAPVSKQKGNETFNATVELIKYDTTSLDGINGVEFSLKYRPEGSKDSGYPVDMGTFTTKHDDTLDKDGVLVLPDLEKGDYLLTEAKNTGYDIAGDNGFTATFTIDNDDDDRTFVVWQDDGKAIDFTVTNGKLDHGAGIPNARQFGQATLRKLGANGSIDATFELQIKVGNEWKTVASNLETGNEYALAFNADGVTATATDAGDLSIGQLRVTGLTWNTYRFQETATASGYLPEDENGPLTSSEFTIGRDNAASTNVGVTVKNQQTELRINKQSPTGETLNGAKFTVTPVGDSTFVNPTALGSDYDVETGAVTLTTKSTGLATLKGQLMVGGTYEIYEVAGPSGYDPVDATFRIHVENNGYLTVVDDQGQEAQLPDGYERTGVDGTGTEAFSFIATNEPMAIDLTKVSAEDGTTLQGAQFRLTGQVMNDGNTTHSYATDANGAIHINDGLMGGVKYSLHEETTPAGYLEMEPLYFYMDSRGEIDPVDVNGNDLADDALPAGWTVNDNKISFTAADEPTRLTLQKTDENGNPLAGATFTVTPANDSKFADGTTDAKTLTTELNADGTVAEGTLIAQLVVGNSYTVQETGAPEGYELVEDSFTVTVEEDGTLAVTGGTLPNGYSRPDNTTFVLTLQDTPVEIGIVKHDATDGAVLLPGATFRIEGDFAGTDETSIERTTDANGRIDLEGLLIVGQEYTVTETKASAGYELRTESMKFMVENDGTLTQTQAATGFGLSAAPAETVEVSDEPIEATLIKTGTDNPDPAIMVGAQFEIKGDFVNQDHEIVKDKALTLTTGGDGTLSLTNMRNGADTSDANIYDLVAGNTYTIEETQAPSEYETVPGTLTFTVNDDGTLTKESGPDAWTISENGGVAVVTATDKPIEVVLQKVSAVDSTKMLEGATFELYKVEEDGTTNKMSTVSTGTDGTLALDGLVGGATYTLHEVTAPAGYELLPDVTFTVTKNGSVELEGETAGYTVAQDNAGVVTITAADTPIDAQLVKTDEAGTPLAGAIFTIQGAFAGDYEGESEITLAPSDANGIVAIPSAALIAGETYTVAEITAPDGFERAGIVKFVVGTDGTITLISNDEGVVSGDEPAGSGAVAGDNTGATDAGDAAVANNDGSIAEVSAAVSGTNGSGTYTASADGGMAVITATNHPVEVTITKTDGGEGLLPGAEFTATAKVDGDQGGVGDAHSVTATTDENGVAVLSGLIAGTTYTLAETKAPAGYELLTDTLEFTVQPDGTIDAGWFPPAAFSIGTAKDSVTVADNPLEVSLVKRAPNGAPLAGAEFTVEGQFPDGEISKTFTSDESGIVFNQIQLAGSAEGTHYAVTETKAPEGYALPEGSLDLVVFEDGTVQVADGSSADMKENASVEESNGVAIVSLNNEPLPGTELPKTSDSAILPLIAGALGLLGLWALVMGGITYRRFRGSED